MAAYHNRLIDGFFIRPFYKMMLSKPILLQDIEAVDGEYYKSMKFIMDTDDVESLDLVFTSESDVYGQVWNSLTLFKFYILIYLPNIESWTWFKTERKKYQSNKWK